MAKELGALHPWAIPKGSAVAIYSMADLEDAILMHLNHYPYVPRRPHPERSLIAKPTAHVCTGESMNEKHVIYASDDLCLLSYQKRLFVQTAVSAFARLLDIELAIHSSCS